MSSGTLGRSIGVGLACVPMLLLAMAPSWLSGARILEFDDVDGLYRGIAGRVARGQVPYRDFLFEYPVGCLPQILLPRLAGEGVIAYRIGYAAAMLLANALLVMAIAREVERGEGRASVARRLGWYLLCFVFLGRLIACRLDVVPALLAFLAAAEWSAGRPIRGGVLAAIGALVKLFPALTVLPAGARELSQGRGSRSIGLLAFAITFATGLAAWGAVGGLGMLDAILFHAERGLEIGSVAAGLLMLAARITGESLILDLAHGSVEIEGAWTSTAVAASRYLQAAALALTMLAFVRSRGRSVVRGTGALILAAIATAPVLSPQFLIWALPFVMALDGPAGRRARPIFAAACALTFLIYPVMFLPALLPMRVTAIAVLNLRNAAVVGLWAILAFGDDEDRAAIDAG